MSNMKYLSNFDVNDFDVVVVGAGLTGSILARHFADIGKHVLIIEKRNHIAGNMYDYINEDGIRVQKYGPHSFHTNNEDVNRYIQKFTSTEDYILKCSVFMHGQYTPSPFNFKTIDQFYSKEDAQKLKEEISKEYPNCNKATIVELLNSKNTYIHNFAKFLFDSDYSLYTAKQWGIKPSEIDPSVLKRVPVLFNYDEQYFYDKYQYLPKNGFTEFTRNILDSDLISVALNTDFFDYFNIESKLVKFKGKEFNGIVVYSGPIDRLFSYKFGHLPYRSLRFEFKTLEEDNYQEAAVTAYPEEKEFTRITEYTKMPFQKNGKTTIAVEYPLPSTNENEPYYPILTDDSINIVNKYKEFAKDIPHLIVCGRLGDFKYYNMDQAIVRAFEIIGELK